MLNNKREKRTAEKINELIARYKRGETLKEIGSANNISAERVRQLFEKVGYVISQNPQDRGWSQEKKAEFIEKCKARFSEPELRRLYIDEKKPAPEIGRILGYSQSQILHALRVHGIPVRTHAEAVLLYPVKYPDITRETLFKLYIEENKSLQEVADVFGCARVTIAKKMQAFGIRKLKPGKGSS